VKYVHVILLIEIMYSVFKACEEFVKLQIIKVNAFHLTGKDDSVRQFYDETCRCRSCKYISDLSVFMVIKVFTKKGLAKFSCLVFEKNISLIT